MFIRLSEAMQTVIELARQNVLGEGEIMQDEEILRPMAKAQTEAIDTVEDYATNHLADD